MTLCGFQLNQPVKDLEGTAIEKQVQSKGEASPKNVPYTVLMVIRDSLTFNFAHLNIQDPHEDKKYEIYDLIRRMLAIGNTKETITLESEEITIIKDRMRKVFNTEVYGFVVDVLNGKNKDFAIVEPAAHHPV